MALMLSTACGKYYLVLIMKGRETEEDSGSYVITFTLRKI